MLYLFPGWAAYVSVDTAALTLEPLLQLEGPFAPGRRHSNSGYRKLSTSDRFLLFMMRFRRAVPFQGLAIMFGVSSSTAYRYYEELLAHFHKEIVPLLFHPLTGQQIDQMTPEDALRALPGARFIVDATGFKLKSAENSLLSRLLYSAYHHASEGFVVFGKGWRAGACHISSC